MFFKDTNLFSSGGTANFRIPSLIVTNNGTVIAFCTNRVGTLNDHADEIALVCSIKKPGQEWSEVRVLAHMPGWNCNIGSAVYDSEADRVIVLFVRKPVARNEFGKYSAEEEAEMERRAEEAKKIAAKQGITAGYRMLVSDDNGETFTEMAQELEPVLQKHWDGTEHLVDGFTHGSSHGICLRHGAYAGRLLCPSRTQIGEYTDWTKIRECVYNNAVYSDDHGMTWKTANCVQVGTGEGTLIERGDGSILYNSRAYFRDGKRYLAVSRDGGATYGEFSVDEFLLEEMRIGCNASFLRVELEDIEEVQFLPEGAKDLVVFCNPRSEIRNRMTACVSFDSGEHYREAKVIFEGPCAYSSLDYDRNTGHFYLLYEKGTEQDDANPYAEGLNIAEFDLEWLMQEI